MKKTNKRDPQSDLEWAYLDDTAETLVRFAEKERKRALREAANYFKGIYLPGMKLPVFTVIKHLELLALAKRKS